MVFAWVVCGLCTVPSILHAYVLLSERPMAPQPWWYTLSGTLGLLGVPIVGALIVSRIPRKAYGWIWLGLALAGAVVELVSVTSASLPEDAPDPWVQELLIGWAFVGFLVCFTLLLLLFPDSRPPSPRWAWVSRTALSVGAALIVAMPFVPTDDGVSLSPFALSGGLGAASLVLLNIGFALLFGLLLVSTAAVPVRWRRAEPAERRQLKWFALGAAWFVPSLVFTAWFDRVLPMWANAVLMFSGFAALQVAVGIAILRHGLYDVDRVINRTLLYVALSACLLIVYAGVVVASSVLLAEHVAEVERALATAAVALLVLPLRARLQRAVNRLTFGRRGDPYEVLADLGHRLAAAAAPESVLPGVVQSVAVTLRLPYVAIMLQQDGAVGPHASYGQPVAEPVSFALTHQGEQLGVLLASPRSPRESLTSADRRLLADLAQHAGVAAQSVLLAHDLRRSRARVLAAREEERRRLRRDLHDGLGPTLAAVALGLDTVRRRLDQPDRAAAMLARLSADLQGTIEEIRRIVHDLRPPVLDQLGLVDAIRADARRFESESAMDSSGLSIDVQAPVAAPSIPAAVEVAAYRIAGEALTNVVRHSGARRCTVRLAFNGDLELDVTDDGCGLPVHHRRGVGLSSMVERAAEVGGRCDIVTHDLGGTLVSARLPLETPT